MTVFILGPSRDETGGDAPLQARRDLAQRMNAAATPAIVMEDEPATKNENSFAKFRRLIHERKVTTFLVIVPLRSRLHGVSVEIGHLLTEIQEDHIAADRVHLALQTLLASMDDRGVMALKEPGNRTRYYEDLIDEGCPIHRWTDRVELNRVAVAVAMADDAWRG